VASGFVGGLNATSISFAFTAGGLPFVLFVDTRLTNLAGARVDPATEGFIFESFDAGGFTADGNEAVQLTARSHGIGSPWTVYDYIGGGTDTGAGNWTVRPGPAPPSLILASLGVLLAGYRLRRLAGHGA
jgi:hypothetical protein